MISTNTENKMPRSVFWYLLIGRGFFGLVLFMFGVFLATVGNIQATCGSGTTASPCSIPGLIPGVILIVFGLTIAIRSILWYGTFSYLVQDQNITINSGILFRQSKTIEFNKIQNIDNTRGPLQMLFGLTAVNIWTASQDQSTGWTSRSGITGQTTEIKHPEGQLWLEKQDADDLKNYLASKGSVQNVQMAAPAPAPTIV